MDECAAGTPPLMKHRALRQATWLLSSGRLSVGLAAFGLTCLTLAVVSPDSVPRAGATTTPHASAPVASTGAARPTTSSPAAATESARPTMSTPEASAVATPTVHPSPARVTAPVAPARIRIPAIELSVRIDKMGLQKDRTVQVPDDPWRAGWYGLGPKPGQPGSAVILGHVDSAAGPAVFGRLRELRAGDRVLVETPDGATSRFEVVRLATYPNAKFPAEKVYAAPGPERHLNLVTCAGRYTRETGRQANLVVYTRMVQDA